MQDHFGKYAFILEILRIGLAAKLAGYAGLAPVVGGMAFRSGIAQQELCLLILKGADQRVAPAAVDAVVACAVTCSGFSCQCCQVLRIEGDVTKHAADGIRAVKAGGGAAKNFQMPQKCGRRVERRIYGEVGRAATEVVIWQANTIH